MIFGDHLHAPDTVEAAEWIAGACRGEPWTVGALVPNEYEVVLRVEAPPPGTDGGDWWASYRDLYEAIASVGARHTATPDRAWFAIWEGHGFGEVPEVPRFDLPYRTYYLVGGPVEGVVHLRDPSPWQGWRNPDLFWPDDRRWFVATDVDFWSLYVGGDAALIADVAASVPTASEIVPLDRRLEAED